MTDNLGDIRSIRIEDEMRVSYLDYAMSVIVARALPDVRDGLKPVHRRILYTMGEMGLQQHELLPQVRRDRRRGHGQVPPARRRRAVRRPGPARPGLLDALPARRRAGQLRLGRRRPAAAMRYTEARLTAIAAEMLADIDKDTVDYEDNYDGTQKQPTVLPAKLPNLLINGSSGIAVGMATNIPPHHLGEVVDAVVALHRQPRGHERRPVPDRQGPRLPDRRLDLPLRDAAQPADRRAGDDRRDPRDVRPRPRARDHARAVHVRGGAPGPHGDHRQRAAVPGEQGVAAREDRGPRQGQEARRHQRPARRVRPRRHADLHRDQARREPAQGAEQPVQAHGDADVVQPQHARPRRRPAADAVAQERASATTSPTAARSSGAGRSSTSRRRGHGPTSSRASRSPSTTSTRSSRPSASPRTSRRRATT